LGLSDVEAILKNFFPPDKHKFIPLNVEAIQAGAEAVGQL
jgi:2-oxoglutarate ferredoxin oxidoreductase subunit gamma